MTLKRIRNQYKLKIFHIENTKILVLLEIGPDNYMILILKNWMACKVLLQRI